MCYSVPFDPRSLASTDSPGKFFVISSPRKYYIWEYKGTLSKTLNDCSKNWFVILFLQGYFYYWGKRPFFWYGSHW